MAKMKIKELAEELGVDSKEVIKFLNDNGFEAKSSTKGIEDEQINLVKGKFGASSKKEEKPAALKKAEVKTEAKPEAKTEAKPAAKPESKSENAGSEEAKPKKKKNISVVVNTGNSRYSRAGQGQRRPGQGGQRPGQDRRPGQGQNRPIQPRNERTGFNPIKPRPMSERTVRPQATRMQEEVSDVRETTSESRENNVSRVDKTSGSSETE